MTSSAAEQVFQFGRDGLMAMVLALFALVALCLLCGAAIGYSYAVSKAVPAPTQAKQYVTFSSSGIKVDLNRYLSTQEGKDAIRRACRRAP